MVGRMSAKSYSVICALVMTAATGGVAQAEAANSARRLAAAETKAAAPKGEKKAGAKGAKKGAKNADKNDGWQQLFNGKDLTGWTPKFKGYPLGTNFNDTFRVENGILKVSYDKWTTKFNREFGHLFYAKPFSEYVIRIEYRFVGDQVKGGEGWALRNSGVMLHCQPPETMDKDQAFPVSLEAQFLGGNGKDPRSTLNLCTPGTNVVLDGKLHTPHCTNSKSKTIHGDEWVTAEVQVTDGGRKIKHIVDGEPVMEYSEPQYDPKDGDSKKLIEAAGGNLFLSGGYISLQAESHPIEFRKVEVKVLPAEKSPPAKK